MNELLRNIYSEMNNQKHLAAVFLDLSKASESLTWYSNEKKKIIIMVLKVYHLNY